LKILVLTCGHHPNDDRVYKKEIQSLRDHHEDVFLITRNQNHTQAKRANYNHMDISALNLKAFNQAALQLAMDYQPDRIIIHEFELLPLGYKIKKRLNAKLIYDIHEAHIEMWDTFSAKPAPVKYLINKSLNAYEVYFLKYVDKAMTPLPRIVTRYQDRNVPTAFVPNYPRSISAEPNKPDEPISVIYHGQISFERGLADLINAFQDISEQTPGIKLDIYGSERVPGTIRQLEQIIDTPKINIHQPISQEAIFKKLIETHIGVIPFQDHSMFRVAVPIKLFEYMLNGCAVLSSNLLPIYEFAKNTAMYYTPGDNIDLRNKLHELIINTELRIKIADAGLQKAKENFVWSKVEGTFLSAVLD